MRAFKNHVSLLLTAWLVCLCQASFGQVLQLEEIIVTAQKRAESLQDVPISVAVVSGDELRDANLSSLNDMQVMVPNFQMTDNNVIATWVFIRGIGSGSNDGFEQSVGLFVDEIYGGRGRQFRAPFLDIERVEVLRGPQGALFGKNTIAGAVNITTSRPTDEFSGYVEALYEPEHGERRLSAAVNLPFNDRVRARFAASDLQFDGFLENSLVGAPEDAFSREERVFRGWLEADLADNATLAIKYEDGRFDTLGMNTQLSAVPEGFLPSLQAADPGFEFQLDQYTSFGGAPTDFSGRGEDAFDNTDTRNALARLDVQLGEHTLTYIGGYSQFEFERLIDSDFSPLNLLVTLTPEDEYEQYSHELRWVSAPGERFEWVAGAYYQDSDYRTSRRNVLNGSVFSEALQIRSQVLDGEPVTNPLGCTALNTLFGGLLAGGPAGLQPILANLQNPLRGAVLVSLACQISGFSQSDYQQNNETLSAYAEGTWHLNDRLRLMLGLRWTEDQKTGDQDFVLFNAAGEPRDPSTVNAAEQNALLANRIFFGNAIHQFSGKRDKTNLSAAGRISWDVTDQGALYLSVAQGFKAGGFNVQQTGDDFSRFEFGDETALTIELGGKFRFASGAGRLNVALFHTQYEDLQVSIFNGVGFDVQNAAEVTSQGLELDGAWRLTDRLTVGGALALLDSSYDRFPNAPCLAEDETRARIAGLPPCSQDLAGVSTFFAPDYSGNVYVQYHRSLNDRLVFTGRLNTAFTDNVSFAGDNDPLESVDANVTVEARLAIGDQNGRWELALIGKNLTDEIEVANYGADVPLLTGTHFSSVTRPRSIALQGRVRFP